MSTSSVINALSMLTIIGQAIFVIALIALIIFLVRKKDNGIMQFVREHDALFCGIVALVATLGSLYFSEIAQFLPCRLCWFQRIFMYPLVAIWWIAYFWKTHLVSARVYGLLLSCIGILFAGYHYYIQVISPHTQPCAANDPVSCADKVVLHYGYITIPMMALTAFAMIIVFVVVRYASHRLTQSSS